MSEHNESRKNKLLTTNTPERRTAIPRPTPSKIFNRVCTNAPQDKKPQFYLVKTVLTELTLHDFWMSSKHQTAINVEETAHSKVSGVKSL
jgi:hypothetical protein